MEDNEINLRLIMTFLSKRDTEVLHAAMNGKIAVEMAESQNETYDFKFMDISMPVMDGLEATRTIRSIEKERQRSQRAYIVAFTGLSSSSDEANSLASGVDLFLSKPVSFREVERLLEDWEKELPKVN